MDDVFRTIKTHIDDLELAFLREKAATAFSLS